MQTRSIAANGLDFTVLEEGPADGPLALCLHGFPDTAHTFRHLLPALAEEGFHAAAPFLRGYAPSGLAPDGSYQTGALVADACALHEALGGDERAVIVGHDWGAIAANGAASHQPARWRKVARGAVPPPGAMGGFISYDQLRRSWYMFFFQSGLADVVVPMNDLAFIDRLWADWSPGYDASADLALIKDSLRPAGHLAAALGYYRAQFGSAPENPALEAEQAAAGRQSEQPTLYFHGDRDGCIGVEMAEGVLAHLPPRSELMIVEEAGHFAHLEKPAEVNRRIVEFLGAP